MIRLRYPYWVGLLFLCLTAFSLLSAAETDTTANNAPAIPTTLPSFSNEALLNQMLVTDINERSLDGLPAIAITFSQKLKADSNFNNFITLTSDGKMVQGSWILASDPRRLYFTNITPQTDYRVQIRPGISAENGLPLQKPIDFAIKTRDVQPSFDFASRGMILPTKLASGLPIRVVNVPELEIEFLRVTPDKLPDMLKSISLGERVRQYQLEEIHAVTQSVYTGRYTTDAKPNARTSLNIPVGNIEPLKVPGLYFAVMHQPGRFGDDAYKISPFFVTNIGLHVRVYKNAVEVFANSLDAGKPLSGINLKLSGEKESLEATSNEQGQASFKTRPTGNLLLIANAGEQFAFLDMRDPALDLSEYSVSGLNDQAIAPFIYSTRDLYRPGETVDLAILLRDRDGKTVDIKNINLKIIRPDSKPLLEQNLVVANQALGYFNQKLALPSDAATGSWKAEVRLNAKDENAIASFDFHVEEFMPERMKLALSSATPILKPNEKLVLKAQGDYLYGAPASGNKVSLVRTIDIDRHPLKQWETYYFGNPADDKLIKREDLPEINLDEKGAGLIESEALDGKLNSPLTISLIATLHETGGRGVTRKFDQAFWPANNLVGIQPSFKNDTALNNSDAQFNLVRVNSQGLSAPSNQSLAVTLVREEKEYFWEYNDSEGWQRKDIASEYPLTLQKVQLDSKGQAKVSFPVTTGFYRLEVEDPETKLKTAYAFHAGWDWEQSENNAARPDQIELALDKPAYKAGDTVNLKITPPSAGEAIVAVEGSDLLWSQPISLPATGASVAIPVNANWARHDLYITVTNFRPASVEQKIAPNRALGIIYLPLDRADRKLNLAIDAPVKIQPESKVSVTVSADNLQGQSAFVTLSAVDVGVLNITDFKTPDPFKYYFSQHAYSPAMYDAYGKIIESVDGAMLRQRFGGDGIRSKGGAYARPDLKIVSLFSGAVAFNADGKATIELNIPGFDGTVRLMALAATSDKLGSAEKDMQVASPVVASLAAPRFLAAGDSAFVTVDLNNTTQETLPVSLKVSADPILGLSPLNQNLTIAAGKRQALRLPVTAQQAFGLGNVQLELSGKGFTAHRQLAVSVRPAYPAKQLAIYKEIPPGQNVKLDSSILQGLLPAGATASLTLAASSPLPLQNALQDLLQYPYGCLEQTTSSAWPYLYLEPDVAEKLGLKSMDMQERSNRVNSALLRLAGMQLSDGGFSTWEDESEVNYWLTPYVTDFLLDAKERGFAVPEWMLQRALKNLQEHLQEGERYIDSRYEFSDSPAHLDLATRAYAAYVLSRVKQAPLGTIRVIYDQEANNAKSGLPLVHLGLALSAQGDKQRADASMKRGLETVRDDKLYLGDYGSALRDQAAMLYLMLRYKTNIGNVSEQTKKLSTMLHANNYLSTQEQLFTFLAGKEILTRAKDGWKAKLSIGGNPVDLSGTTPLYRSISMDELQKGIEISSSSGKLLYVGFNMEAYPAAAPEAKTDHIQVTRQWYNLQGKKLNAADLKPGMLLLTYLNVSSNDSLRDALVVDLVPAGLEVENTNLANNESLEGLQLEGTDKPLTELVDSTTLKHQEFRDDRYVAALALEPKTRYHLFYLARVVSSGKFAVPPPTVLDMYRPEFSGIGAAPSGLAIP